MISVLILSIEYFIVSLIYEMLHMIWLRLVSFLCHITLFMLVLLVSILISLLESALHHYM